MTDPNEIEIEKIRASTNKFSLVCGVIKHFISIGCVLASLKILFTGLQPFLTSNPEAIKAIALIIEKINFSNITGYLLASATGTGWYIERKGKKRAIHQKGKYQKMVESADSYRSSSGLTKSGETPGEEE
jgi:hypothetical protein